VLKTVLASPIHERFWLQAQLDPSNSAYNVAFVHRVDGLLDVDALQAAFDAVVAHHEILRTTCHDTAAGLSLHIHETMASPLVRQRVDPEEFEDVSEAFVARLHVAPFDLSEGPALRAGVLTAGPDTNLLVTVVHHIALDGAAIPVLFGQLGEAYEALVVSGAELPTWPLSEVASGEAAEVTASDLDYWRDAMACTPVHTPLPTLPAGSGDRSNAHLITLPEPLEAALQRVAKASDASFFQVLSAGWAAYVHRFTGEDVVAFGYPVSLRPREASQRVGCFVNTLPMVLTVGGASFAQVIARTRGARRAAKAHQHVPWERIVESLRTEGLLGPAEQFLNVGIAATHLRHVPLSLATLEVAPQAPPPVKAIWELLLEVEVGTPTRLRLCGREDRFAPWLVTSLMTSLLALLERACEAPEAPLDALPLVDAEDRLRLLVHGQGRDLEPAAAGTLGARFARIAIEHADDVAIQTGADGMTYWALDVRSNRSAHALLSLLEGRPAAGARVGLLFERSAEAAVSMLAVVKLGLTYVPLRPTDPVTRWMAQLEASGAVAVMGHNQLLEQLPDAIEIPRFSLDVPGCLSGQPDEPVSNEATAETGAYVMFTSGSTGEPKGVVVPHRAVMRLACGGGAYALSADDVVVHGASLAFDLSTWEIWGGLLMGARLIVLSRVEMQDTARLAEVLSTHKVTALALATPLFQAHVDSRPQSFAGLDLLLVGGDVLDPAAAAAVLGEAAGRPDRFVNGYGPTENTVFSTVARVQPAPTGEVVPIGRPIAGGTSYVVDPEGGLVPVGFPGELWVGGAGLALGYDGLKEETRARFVDAPEALGASAGRLYRTGDRARWRADGQLDFMGRVDRQIKIRGRRLEPGEVSAAAKRHADVRQAVVVATRTETPELVLAYTLDSQSRLNDRQLLDHLSAHLPAHAIPVRRVRVGAIPLNVNGKIDVSALLAIAPERVKRERTHAPAQSDTERRLLALWCEQLDHPDLGVLDRFVDVGGDSLRAVRLVAKIRDDLGGPLSVADIYRLGTIRALALALDGDLHNEVIPLARTVADGSRPRTVPLGLAQVGHWYMIRRGMSYTCPCVLHLQGRIDAEVLLEAWDDVLARHEIPWMQIDLKEPRMHRVDSRMCNVIRMDLTRLGPEAARYQVLSRVRRTTEAPFINRSPMLTAMLAQTDHASWYFAFVAPQALVDGHTLQLLARELHDTYMARLDGAVFAPPLPMSLSDYHAWEAARVTEASIEASVAYYRETQDGDASWTVPTSHLQSTIHGETAHLASSATEALHGLAQSLGISLEATLTYCVFLTLHGVHRAPLMRCLSAYHNRDEEALEALPVMMAGAMYQQSRLDRGQSFGEGLSQFSTRYVSGFPHARLPAMALFGMSRQLFMRGTLRHYAVSRVVGALWSAVSATPRVVLTYSVDLLINSVRYALERRITGWFRRARTRTVGCMISITTPLSAYRPLGSVRLPIHVLRTPVDVPEAIPGDPRMDIHRDAEGIKALFQARYKPAAVRAFVAAYAAMVERVASSPGSSLGALIDGMAPFADAFERADDSEQ
jgi:amino acid adenylation domain-containing protein